MPKTSVTDWDTTAANNTDINSIDIDENCAPSGINNAIREQMAQIATAMTTGGLSGIAHLAKSGTYTVLEADRGKCIDCSAALTLNLTAAATMQAGWACYVKADGGDVTVDPNSTEQIEGTTTLTVSDGSTALIYTDGTAWYVAISTRELLDEDNMASDSATKPASQQSVKAYVDAHILDEDDFATDSATKPPSQQSVGAYLGNAEHIQAATALALPDPDADYVMVYDADAGTGKKVLIDDLTGWAYLSTTNASAAATVDIDLPSGYNCYKIFVRYVVPSTNDSNLYLRTSADGGSTYDTGATDYRYGYMYRGSDSSQSGSNGQTTYMQLGGTQSSTSNRAGNLEITIFNPAAAQYTHVHWDYTYYSGSAVQYSVYGGGEKSEAEAVDSIRLLFSAGNISGDFELYGIK